jgi:hypothetical protein
LFWDASAESLGIGVSSALRKLQVLDSAFFGNTNSGVVAGDNGGVPSVYGMNAAGDTYKPFEIRTGPSGTGFNQDTSGRVGIGTSSPNLYGKTAIQGGKAGTANSNLSLLTDGDAQNEDANLAFYGTFVGTADNGPRRTADITSGFNGGNWGTEYLSFNVGKSGSTNDTRTLTTERMRIDSSGRLNMMSSAGASPVLYHGNDLSSTSPSTNLSFGNEQNGALLIYTNSSEAMRIDSSGNLLVGTTDNSPVGNNDSNGIALLSNGSGQFSRDGGTALLINRKTSDGELLRFNKDGTTVGSIGVVNTNNLRIGGTVASHAGMQFGTNILIPESGGLASNGGVDLGADSIRFKDLYLSGGVYLGGTGSANKLDDYETGTFTPTVEFGGASTGITYLNRTGRYVKIGTLVYVNIAVNLSDKGSSTGAAKITGLPFTQSSEGTNFPNLNLRSVNGIAFTNCLYATANDGSTEIQLMDDNGSGTQANLTNTDFNTTTELNITGVYEAS